MNCEDARPQLTAYLDGDLADERGSALRGHLRTCAACRQVAADEGALRDGLRQLVPVDPPPSLWANVQAQLAAAEMRDAEKPTWKRTLGRLVPRLPAWPQLAAGCLAVATIVTFVIWRSRGSTDEQPTNDVAVQPATHMDVAPTPAPLVDKSGTRATVNDSGDVTADLASEPARVTESYADAAEELLVLANEARAEWSADQRDAFDARVAELRAAVTGADAGRPQQKAWRALIRYLQTAAVRDEVALASTGGMP